MTRARLLIAICGGVAVACVTAPDPAPRLSAEGHDEQARLATTARDHAAHLRSASDLRRAEAAACAPSSEPHEGHAPLLLPGGIASVTPDYQGVTHWTRALRGASLLVPGRGAPDIDATRDAIDCHLARAATHGWTGPGQDSCPLCVPGASATVSGGRDAIVITILGKDVGDAEEILRRSRALLSTPNN